MLEMDSVKCPFCGEERDDLWELFICHDDGAEATIECYGCDKEYTIIQNISVTYSTNPDPDFEEYLDRHPEIRKQLEEQKTRLAKGGVEKIK